MYKDFTLKSHQILSYKSRKQTKPNIAFIKNKATNKMPTGKQGFEEFADDNRQLLYIVQRKKIFKLSLEINCRD